MGLYATCRLAALPAEGIDFRSGAPGHKHATRRDEVLSLGEHVDRLEADERVEDIRRLASDDFFAPTKYMLATVRPAGQPGAEGREWMCRRRETSRAVRLVARSKNNDQEVLPTMKMLFIGTHGSESPTHAVLPFLQAQGAIDEGHETEVFVVGDAVVLMKDAVAKATVPVGWPPVGEVLAQLIEHKVPLYV